MTKTLAFAFAALLAAGSLPAMAQSRDTGSMGYPAPLQQGNVGTTTVGPSAGSGGNTGSMAYPAPAPQGRVGTTAVPTGGNPNSGNTGGAQYPAPAPQGNVGTTTVR